MPLAAEVRHETYLHRSDDRHCVDCLARPGAVATQGADTVCSTGDLPRNVYQPARGQHRSRPQRPVRGHASAELAQRRLTRLSLIMGRGIVGLLLVYSCMASSRFARNEGSAMTSSSSTAAIRNAAEIGRVKNTEGSPNEIIMVRRRFSSIIGPRMNPSTMGAGSQSSLSSTYPTADSAAIS